MRYFLLLTSALLMLSAGSVQAQESEEEETQEQAEAAEDSEEGRRVRRLSDVVGEGSDEFSMEIPAFDAPVEPREPQPNVSLPDPDQDARLQSLLTTRAFVPNDPDVQQALDELLDEVEADIRAALADDDLETASQLARVIGEVEPDREIVAEVQALADQEQALADSLAQAAQALEAGRLTAPPGDNAAELFQRALELDAGNEAAQGGLADTHQALLARAVEHAQEMEFEAAERRLDEASEIHEAPEAVAEARESIGEFRQRRMEELHGSVLEDIDSGRFDEAEEGITQLVALGHERARIESLESSLADARLYGSFEPGQVFNDTLARLDRDGPEMVVVPAGDFMMGSPEDENDRMGNEGPRHRVTFNRGFAMARTEVTVRDFALFVEDTGYETDAEREGSSRVYKLKSGRMDQQSRVNWRHDYTGERAGENLPVIHVSWNDAAAYANWLTELTGRTYRLPSEAEFEYALRAGSQTPYWWGEGSPDDDDVENVTGDDDDSPTGARWNVAFRRYEDGFWGPAPAGSLRPNPFGLYDMGGNVMEWVEDCWHDSFVRAPDDGSAWVNPGCNRRVIKGASWSSTPAMSRSAFRISSRADSTDMRVGFRVGRDL